MTSYIPPTRPPPSVLIAQATGLTLSTFLLGANTTMAFVTIPSLMLAPSPLAAQQWKKLYDGAKPFGIVCSVGAAVGTGYLAYVQPPSLERTLNVLATAILPSILPFTLLVIKPVNDRLFKKAETLSLSLSGKGKSGSGGGKALAKEEDRTNKEGTKALIERWTLLHLVRTGITGVGVGCVVWGVVVGQKVL